MIYNHIFYSIFHIFHSIFAGAWCDLQPPWRASRFFKTPRLSPSHSLWYRQVVFRHSEIQLHSTILWIFLFYWWLSLARQMNWIKFVHLQVPEEWREWHPLLVSTNKPQCTTSTNKPQVPEIPTGIQYHQCQPLHSVKMMTIKIWWCILEERLQSQKIIWIQNM